MNKAIKAMHAAGLTLKDFRNKTKAERQFAWLLVVSNWEWTEYKYIEGGY